MHGRLLRQRFSSLLRSVDEVDDENVLFGSLSLFVSLTLLTQCVSARVCASRRRRRRQRRSSLRRASSTRCRPHWRRLVRLFFVHFVF